MKSAFALSVISLTEQTNGFSNLPLSSQGTRDLLHHFYYQVMFAKHPRPDSFSWATKWCTKVEGHRSPQRCSRDAILGTVLYLSEYNIYIRMNQELFMFHLKPQPLHLVSFLVMNLIKELKLWLVLTDINYILIPCKQSKQRLYWKFKLSPKILRNVSSSLLFKELWDVSIDTCNTTAGCIF